LTGNSAATLAARQVTDQVPTIFNFADPVEAGIISNLARPGGNATGWASPTGAELIGKQLELLIEFAPTIQRVAFLQDGDFPPAVTTLDAAQDAARRLGVQLRSFDVRTTRDLAPAFAAAAAWPADGVLAGVAVVADLTSREVDRSGRHRDEVVLA